MVKFTFLAILGAAATAASAAPVSGNYRIRDFQNRCLDFAATSTDDSVPVVTTPCSSAQSQIWHVLSDSPFSTTYVVFNTAGAFSQISYASSESFGSGLRQQLQLKNEVGPDEDLFLTSQDGTHWKLSNLKGGGLWTSWAARSSNPQLASPVTLEEAGSSADAQQLFTFDGPI